MSINKLSTLILVAISSMLLQECKKGNTVDPSQDFFNPVQVKTQLNLNLPQYTGLAFPQGYAYLPEGNRGIVVYHTPMGEYVAYDRTCSVNPAQACSQVTVDSSLANLRCGSYKVNAGFQPCCNSKFDLNTGVAISGSAKLPLKSYYVSFDESTKILYISSSPF